MRYAALLARQGAIASSMGTVVPSSTFGVTTVGGSWGNLSNGYVQAQSAVASVSGSVSKITAYLDGNGPSGTDQPLKAVLYADSAGAPGALVAASAEVTVVTAQAAGWVDFAFSGGSVVNGTAYWLGLFMGGNGPRSRVAYAATGSWDYRNVATYPTVADPFGSPSVAANHTMSLYATVA